MHHQTFLRTSVYAILILLTTLAVTCNADTISKTPSVQNPVVARVNGKEITAEQLKSAVDTLIASQADTKLTPETLNKVKNNMLESLISQELVYQDGMKLGVKDLDKQVAEAFAKVKARFVNDGYFQEFLHKNGMTEKELGDSIRSEVVVKNFIAETIDAKTSISEEECRKYYEQNIDRFTTPEKVRVSHILIPVRPNMSDVEKKGALEKADSLRKELLGGADFAQLAREKSGYASSKVGGDLGFVARSEVHPDFAQAAFALKSGELSAVVETPAGYQIIKLRERSPSVTTSFTVVKSQIESYLKNQKSDAAFQEYLKKAREKSKVEVLLK